MAIKKVRIDPAKLGISANPAADRRRIFAESQWAAESKIDHARGVDANHGAGAIQIREKLQRKGLFLDLDDLMGGPSGGPRLDRADVFQGMDMGTGYSGMLTEEFPTSHDDRIMEDLTAGYDRPQRPAQPAQYVQPQARSAPQARQALRETIMGGTATAPTRQPARSGPAWLVKAYLGETRGGNQVPIWKVSNSRTGTEIDKLFRIESIAQRVAGFLNESGDSNDPRAVSLIGLYDKRDRLMKEARTLEKTSQGKPMKTERLNAIRAEINQLSYRMGI